ncbi:MAG: DUF3520 domain-containing protein [Planctomycetota bacterium]|nr:DUF3520 domain-containing protein [Planctomycetota bacterium]
MAKDVKLQVDFNPAHVSHYRLLGYENRVMAKEDFADDTKDAGDMGAGHTVTALYELVLRDGKGEAPENKYTWLTLKPEALESEELMTVKMRYRPHEGGKSTLLEYPVTTVEPRSFEKMDADFRFATAVAEFSRAASRFAVSWSIHQYSLQP